MQKLGGKICDTCRILEQDDKFKKVKNKHYCKKCYKSENKMKVKVIKRPDCGDTIYSRADHDFSVCGRYSDKSRVFIDGGPNNEYIRYGWAKTKPKIFEIEVNTTAQDLYQDWNRKLDKFGVIK